MGTAAERVMMADHFEIPSLKAAVLDFVCCTKTRLAAVQGTEGFKRLAEQRPRLALAVLAHVAPPKQKRSAEDVAGGLPEDLESLRLIELKRFCAERSLGTSGNKAELIQKLRTHAMHA